MKEENLKKRKKMFQVVGFSFGLISFSFVGLFSQCNCGLTDGMKNILLWGVFGGLGLSSLLTVTLTRWSSNLFQAFLCIAEIYLLYIIFFTKDLSILIFVLSLGFLIFTYRRPRALAFFPKRTENDWKSILVVDDDETLLKIVRPILINHGYSVLTAGTGEAGLEIAKKQKPDLIILDVILPGMKGREVCRQLKENPKTKNIPILFLTAKDSKDDVEAELALGAEAHITKPIDPKELIPLVARVLKKYSKE